MANRSTPSVLQVYIFRDGEFLGTDIFAERQIIVGRDPDEADLVLASTQVSRKHAVIEHEGGRVIVRDTGSTNGILVNKEKVESCEVSRLDEIGIGEFTLKLKFAGKGQRPAEMSESASRTRVMQAPARGDQSGSVEKTKPARRAAPQLAERQAEPNEPVTHVDVRVDAPAKERPRQATDLGDFDDLGDEEGKLLTSTKTHAEFRSRGEVLDRDELGDVLAGIGIAPEEEKPARDDDEEDSPEEPTAHYMPEARSAEEEPAPGDGYEPDDDDEEEEDFEPPYSLVQTLVGEDAAVAHGAKGAAPCIEVLTLRGDSVQDVTLLERGQSFWVGPEIGFLRRRQARDLPPRIELVKYRRNGRCDIEFPKNADGNVTKGVQKVKLSSVASSQGRKQRRRGTAVAGLSQGEVIDVADGALTYHIRFAHPPAPLQDDRPLADRLRPDQSMMRSAGGAVLGHLLAAIVVTIAIPDAQVQLNSKNDEFVEVRLEAEMKLEEPEPEPPPEEPPPVEQPKAVEKVPPKMEAAPRKIKKQKTGGTSPAPPGILGLLNKTGSSAAPGPAAAVAALSNLSAAKVPGGTSGYRVSGLIGKLPTSELSVGGGGGGPVTKGGAALLRGGAGGAGALSGKGERAVGGLVQKVPQQMRSAGQGQLDRDEIQKVINKNINQIQRCYERELLKNPGLSGKVQVEWTVGTNGSVRSTRQKFADLNSSTAVSCILGAIKGWQFPQPRGGEVVVSYPFIFKPIGF